MIKIAHRGNVSGKNPFFENHPKYLIEALNKGYHAELDLRLIDGDFCLGHDEPKYRVNEEFFCAKGNLGEFLWVHCKDIYTLSKLIECKFDEKYNVELFFHDNDDVTLTSSNWIWTYPGKSICSNRAIAVMPELVENWDIKQAGGICSDQF